MFCRDDGGQNAAFTMTGKDRLFLAIWLSFSQITRPSHIGHSDNWEKFGNGVTD